MAVLGINRRTVFFCMGHHEIRKSIDGLTVIGPCPTNNNEVPLLSPQRSQSCHGGWFGPFHSKVDEFSGLCETDHFEWPGPGPVGQIAWKGMNGISA